MKHCLIVDDSSVIRKVAKNLLNSIGYVATEADNGQAALDSCAEKMPDAILLDWDLADMSGFDVLVQLRQRFPTARPHIVYATTENDPIDIARAIKAGASDFVLVPFNRADIEAKFTHGAIAA